MTNAIIVLLMVATFISLMVAIEKNEDIKKKQKQIDEIKDYTTSRWGYNLAMEIERYKKWYEENLELAEFYKKMLDERDRKNETELKIKENYYAKLEELYKEDQRLKEPFVG